jgi:membrane-associated protein
LISLIHQLIDLVLHFDRHLSDFAAAHQIGVYLVLALIVFCETGLVVTPLLPGDSLLFALGALAAAANSPINLPLAIVLLCLAANCGDILNYSIGFQVGPKVFSRKSSWLLNQKHLAEAHQFYERHGRKTIIMARFVPIIRTFAPFVAGVGKMPFARFIGFSISGGVLWVVTLSLCGYFFGQIPIVKSHFQLVVLGIVAISLLPVVFHAMSRGRSDSNPGAAEGGEARGLNRQDATTPS